METTIGIKNVKFGDYRIEFFTNVKSPFCARLFRVLKAGKNKGSEKILEAFRFSTYEKRAEYVKQKIERYKQIANERAAEAKLKAEAKENFVNPYKVGELFYDSWGYEQTNIDFYKIVDLKPRSVVLVRIGQTLVKDAGYLCEYVKPNPEHETDEPFVRPIKFSRDGKTTSFNGHKGYRGAIFPYTAGETGVYQSHYA